MGGRIERVEKEGDASKAAKESYLLAIAWIQVSIFNHHFHIFDDDILVLQHGFH